jgi:putative transposase
MDKISYDRHRFSGIVIQQAVWLYFRFALSYRDVEDMLAERGIDVTYETVRRWVLKFGTIIARKLRRRRPRPTVGGTSTKCLSPSTANSGRSGVL